MVIPLKDENPSRHLPVFVVVILLLNVAGFLYSYLLGSIGSQIFTERLGLIPFEITHASDAISPTPIPLYLTLVTTMFLHGGWMHLGGNMLYLWVFGKNVEDTFGHFRFLRFYLVCGVIASLVHVATNLESTVPLVGASGAIAGVLGAYMAAFPGARIHVLVFYLIVRVPALIVLGFWFVVQLSNASMASGDVGGEVAWYAHIAGFVTGYLWMRQKKQRIREIEMSVEY